MYDNDDDDGSASGGGSVSNKRSTRITVCYYRKGKYFILFLIAVLQFPIGLFYFLFKNLTVRAQDNCLILTPCTTISQTARFSNREDYYLYHRTNKNDVKDTRAYHSSEERN